MLIEKMDIETAFLRYNNNGDEDAFRVLFNSLYQPLAYMAINRGKKKDIAYDIVSEVFVKILERKKSFNDLSHLKAYLVTSVRNACIDSTRNWRKQIEREAELNHLLDHSEDDTALTTERIRADLMDELNREIGLLPGQCKLVFKMAILEGLSTEEIAEKLKLSTQTVLNHKNNGIKKVRKALKRKGLFSILGYICYLWYKSKL